MKYWIQAARLRTLPLSVSGIIVGSAYAYHQNTFNGTIFGLAVLTTLLFQILSNYANDYGDGVRGTDANRIGEKRLVAAGVISAQQMKKAVILFSILSLLSAFTLIYVAFEKENFFVSLIFILLGIGAIGAAIKYTVGSNPYGYSAMGDLFVFVFFGLVSVVCSNFLYSHFIDWKIFLPATSIGLLSVAVLNLNNMRDMENDKTAGKNTLVVKMGLEKAKKYHQFLIAVASFSYLAFTFFTKLSLIPILIIIFPLLIHIQKIQKSVLYEDFDPELKKVALSTFALSLLFWLTLVFIS